ncbi:MAG: hypothetical protein WCR08_13790 [Gammaproteobacteria bacterium]
MLSNKKFVPNSGDPSSGYAAFRMTCWGDTIFVVDLDRLDDADKPRHVGVGDEL